MKRNRFGLPYSMNYGLFNAVFDGGEGEGASEAEKEAAAKARAEVEAAAKAQKEAEAAAAEAEEKAKAEADAAAKAAKDSDDPELNKLAEEKAELLKEVMSKKSELKAANEAATKAKEALDAYGGVDPEKVKALLKQEADAEKAALEAKGDFDRLREVMKEEHQKEMATVKEELEALKKSDAQKNQKINDLTIGAKFSTSEFIGKDLVIPSTKARQLYGSHFEMEGDRIVGYDKPAGQPERTKIVDGGGDPVSFDEAMKRIIDKDPDKTSLMKVKMKPGSRSQSQQKGNTQGGDKKTDNEGLYGVSRIAAGIAAESVD